MVMQPAFRPDTGNRQTVHLKKRVSVVVVMVLIAAATS
jgi:hypothetical protein